MPRRGSGASSDHALSAEVLFGEDGQELGRARLAGADRGAEEVLAGPLALPGGSADTFLLCIHPARKHPRV